MAGRRLLVLGDFMADHTIYGETTRISPEAPAPVMMVREKRTYLGGAGNVVRNIDSLGGITYCAAVVGDDEWGYAVEQELLKVGSCAVLEVIHEADRKTTVKTRVVATQGGRASKSHSYGHHQVIRLDEETTHPITQETADRIIDFAASVLHEVDAVVLSDYAKGALSISFLHQIISMSRSEGKPVFVDPKSKDWNLYRGATVLTPNAREAEISLGISFSDPASTVTIEWERLVQGRLEELGLQALLITRGADGISLIDHHGFQHVPAYAREVFDVTGAGDTVLAAFSLASAAGATYPQAAQIGNLAAGVAVSKAGTAPVFAFEAERELDARHYFAGAKIRSREEITTIAGHLRRESRKVVFTNGCFDLLHAGHMYFLREARKQGDVLIVGLNSDSSVRQLKGESRPIVPAAERAEAIAALESVDYVVVFDELDPLELLKCIRPDILVKGDDYKESEVVGADLLKSYGGIVHLIPLRPGISTTRLVERIRSSS